MFAFEIRILIEAPELAKAISSLASAIRAPLTNPIETAVSVPAPVSAPVVVPTAPAAVPIATPPQQNSPIDVPATSSPQYSLEQIMQAGATLMDAGKASELIALLRSFNVSAVKDLKPEQFGAFATALRGLGAKI